MTDYQALAPVTVVQYTASEAVPVAALASDASVASLVADPSSATATQLSATYGAHVDAALGSGIIDATAAIQAVVDAVATRGGGTVHLPSGTYRTTAPIVLGAFTRLIGDGAESTTINCAHTGNGIQYQGPIGGSNPIRIEVCDLRLTGGTAAAGISVFSAALVNIQRVYVSGFNHGIVFQAVTHGDIDKCTVENPQTTGVWLANASDYLPGYAISPPQTNRITIRRNNIRGSSSPAGAVGIVDDGGWDHNISDNSLEGFDTSLRIAGVEAFTAANNEYESSHAGPYIAITDKSRAGTSVGSVVSATFYESVLDSPLGYDAMVISGAVQYLLLSKFNFHATVPAIKGLSNVNAFFSLLSRNWGTGALTDGSRATGAHNVFTDTTADITTATIRNLIADSTVGLMIGSNAGPIGFWGAVPGNRRGPYSVSNPTALRSLDGSATSANTLSDVIQVVGRLITDLKAYGLLG